MAGLETSLSVLLVLDNVLGGFAGAVTSTIISYVSSKLSSAATGSCDPNKFWPIHVRAVKGQTLWLLLVVALTRFITMKGILPWADEELRVAVSVGCKCFIAFHHMLAIGSIEQ
jgi:hypothetical protein